MSGFKSTTSLISIHALREEGDDPKACRFNAISYFNPRPPRGGRLMFSFLSVGIY